MLKERIGGMLDRDFHEINDHIRKFSEIITKKEIKLEKDCYSGLRFFLYAATWLSKTFELPEEYRKLSAIFLIAKIEDVKKQLFALRNGETIRSMYEQDLDVETLTTFQQKRDLDFLNGKLINERYEKGESLKFYISVLKCLEFLTLELLRSERYITVYGSNEYSFTERYLVNISEEATERFVDVYTMEYLCRHKWLEESRLYNEIKKFTDNSFSFDFHSVVRKKEDELFLKLTSLAYQPIIVRELVSLFEPNEDKRGYTYKFPKVFVSLPLSIEEKLDSYNKFIKPQ